VNRLLKRWRRKIEKETAEQIAKAQEAADTGDERLQQVRKLAQKGAEVRRKDQKMREANHFTAMFYQALKEGHR
jgi:hypothetical protein